MLQREPEMLRWNDYRTYGIHITKDGKRIDPKYFYKENDMELLPCPFCGGKAEFETLGNHADGQGINVWCIKCHSRSPWIDGYYESDGIGKMKASMIWNTRTKTIINKHNLIQFITGYGINQASKLGDAIIKHFYEDK